jgi:hypothetical protein
VDAGFEAQLDRAEVMLLVDQTGSMDGEISEIRARLVDELIPAMGDTFSDLRLGVAGFGDFPSSPYGVAGDLPFVLYQPITNDAAAIHRAADALMSDTFLGYDEPEAQTFALHHLATNQGHPGVIEPTECPVGFHGAGCFGEAARIVLLFTDARFHNGPGGFWPYGYPLRPLPPTYANAVDALADAGIRVIVLWSGPPELAGDAIAIAGDTGARGADGTPLVFDIGLDGERLGRGVVDAMRDLVEGALLDVDAVAVDAGADDVDATRFVDDIVPLRVLPEEGGRIEGAGFSDVRPGTRLTFRVTFSNTLVEAGPEPQVFPLSIRYRDRGLSALGSDLIYVVVPSLTGVGCESVED